MRYRGQQKIDIFSIIFLITTIIAVLIPTPIKKEIVVQEKTVYQPIVIEQETTVVKPTTYVTVSSDNKFLGIYPTAEKIWLELKEFGLNDYACAGILGNIMAEVGGNTLAIDHWEYWSKDNSYGICQWKDGRKLQLFEQYGKDLDAQIAFLLYELPIEMNNFGYLHQKGYNYETFATCSNYEEAALAFGKCFERCQDKYIDMRVDNAKIAYEYFVGSAVE